MASISHQWASVSTAAYGPSIGIIGLRFSHILMGFGISASNSITASKMWAHIRRQVFGPARSASARGAQPASARLFRSSARPAKTRLSAGTPWFSSRPAKPPFDPAHALPHLAKESRCRWVGNGSPVPVPTNQPYPNYPSPNNMDNTRWVWITSG